MKIEMTRSELYEAKKILEKENLELKQALVEINSCVDSFYTQEEPRRLFDEPLSAFSGYIQVIDKVSSIIKN
ncbi:hypothetical protein ACI2JA_03625 [Alkalihalobacillus sp. NPDC078783]